MSPLEFKQNFHQTTDSSVTTVHFSLGHPANDANSMDLLQRSIMQFRGAVLVENNASPSGKSVRKNSYP